MQSAVTVVGHVPVARVRLAQNPPSRAEVLRGPSQRITRVAWVAYLDVYGFVVEMEAAERSASLPALYQRLQKAQTEVTSRKHPSTLSFVLSDNIFLVAPVDVHGSAQEALEQLTADIRKAIVAHMKYELFLRGAAAFGDVAMGPNLLVGAPVSRAVKYEAQIRSPFVFIPEGEIRRADTKGKKLRDLPVRVENREGLLRGMLVAPKNPSEFLKAAAERYKQFRSTGPAHVAFAWKTAFDLIEADFSEGSKR